MEQNTNNINIKWQSGVVSENGVNGVQVGDVLAFTLERLKELNAEFPCRENSITITKLEEAIMWQDKRTNDRVNRGVEGKEKA